MLHGFYLYLKRNQVILALFLLCLGWITVQLKEFILSIFISYILMAALLPLVRFLKNHKFPTILAVMIPYLFLFFFLFLLIFPLVPFFIEQIISLATGLPIFVNKITQTFGLTLDPVQVEHYFNGSINVGGSALAITSRVFGGIFTLFTIIVVSLYLLLYHETFKNHIAQLFHKELRPEVHKTFTEIDEKLGAWIRGQVVLCLIIGILTWVALTIMNLPYAIPLAVLAGILEIVPTLGPIMSAVPAVIVALTISPTLALVTIGVYIIIQLLENHLIVPNIMNKAVGLNPLLVIVAVIIGSKLLGIMGALLSIPFVALLIIVLKHVSRN